MRNKRVNDRPGCTIVTGKAGIGKTALQSNIIRLFLARSDVSQLRDAYTDADRGRLADAIRQNTRIWYSLNSGGERHGR